jgi:hypothetical protein
MFIQSNKPYQYIKYPIRGLSTILKHNIFKILFFKLNEFCKKLKGNGGI